MRNSLEEEFKLKQDEDDARIEKENANMSPQDKISRYQSTTGDIMVAALAEKKRLDEQDD